MFVGSTLSELGAAPIEHINIAPTATGWPMMADCSRVGGRSRPINLRGVVD
jgi:hypothetical protein